MLETLRIQNYALIDDVEVSFRSGFNVLTGETGAGKSIIVGALNLVLGARASSETVRGGTKQARIDAVFRITKPARRLTQLLDRHDVHIEEDTLILTRVVTAEARSRAYMGGSLVPVAVLAQVGDELVDLHGQHEHQSLLKPDRQLDLLDGFAGAEEAFGAVAGAVAELRDLEKAIAELESDDRERLRRLEFLRFEVNEINKAGLEPGEEEDLRARHNIIANAERILALAAQARTALYEGDDTSAVGAIDSALGALNELAEIDARFRPLAEQVSVTRLGIEETAREVREHTTNLEFDPRELDALNERLALIGNLKRKYGASIEAILEYRDTSAAEIEAFESRDQRLQAMRTEQGAAQQRAMKLAQALSARRRTAAKKLNKHVTAALQELGMKGGRFEIAVEEAERLSASGIDRVAFLFSANPGEALKPLRHVASGGEISRVMLALKAVFAHADKIPTLIFDEIDAGVGGHIAGNVAAKLRQLAGTHQTICITHLPQIAASAQNHYHVHKSTQRRRAVTTVSPMEGDARVEEVARLLDGSVSEVSIEHARALLRDG